MYLYEKDKNIVNVYELKERRDKLFEYKKNQMEQQGIDESIYSIFSNNPRDISMFRNICEYDVSNFIKKYNSIFKHKNGLKLSNMYYFFNDKIIIDGLLYELYRGDFDYHGYKVTKIYDKTPNKVKKYFLQTTSDIKIHKTESFCGESYKYELPNIISIPESIYLLKKLIQRELFDLVDKNINEQLALYDFEDTPIQKLDLETVRFMNKNYLTDNDLEIHDNILKKVRQLHK